MFVELGASGTGDEFRPSISTAALDNDNGDDDGDGADAHLDARSRSHRRALRPVCHALRHIAAHGGSVARRQIRLANGVTTLTNIIRNCADPSSVRGAAHILRHLAEGFDGGDYQGSGVGGHDAEEYDGAGGEGEGEEGEEDAEEDAESGGGATTLVTGGLSREARIAWRDFEGMGPLTSQACVIAAGTGGGGGGGSARHHWSVVVSAPSDRMSSCSRPWLARFAPCFDPHSCAACSSHSAACQPRRSSACAAAAGSAA